MSPLLTDPLRDTLIREAFRQARGGIPMTILAIIGIAWIRWLDTHTLIAPLWMVSALAISFGRAVILGFVLRHQDQLNIHLREWLFNGPLILSSLIWASLPVVAFPAASDHEKFGILCVLAGLAGGAASVLAPVKWPARLYLFCVLIPGAVLIRLDTIGPVLSTLGVCFFVAMLLSHATARKLLIEAIGKRSENQGLLADLQRERGEVEKLNLDLRAAETALRAQNSLLEREVAVRSERNRLAFAVIQNTAEGVLVTDPDGMMVEVNPAFTRITGYSAEDAIGVSMGLLTPEGPTDRQQAQMMEVLAETGKWEGELWSRRKDGSLFLERRSIDAVRDASGTTTHYVSVFNDVTEDHHKDEQLRHMACHDPLTGLANRSLLNEHLRMAIAQGKRQHGRAGILFLDLDQFKSINDTLGHDVGDLLLKEVAHRLHSCLRATDTLARLGGDEFVVLLNSIRHPDDCGLLAGKLMEALGKPVEIAGVSLHVNTSIGITVFPDDGDTVEVLMKNADMALYAAKGAGKNRYDFFHASMSEKASIRRELESALRDALAEAQLGLHFQPKFDARLGHVCGFEALVRWDRAGHGFVPPDLFIPVAEESGLIDELGRTVIDQACAQLAAWHQAGYGWQKVAVNVSARQLIRQDLPRQLRNSMTRHGIPAGSLEIEVTESVVMTQPETTIPLLADLRRMGIRIAIDDFGTGHSSLAYLRKLPIDVMKIDRSFVQEAEHNPTSQAIIRTIVSLSQALRLSVVAEGVESAAQAAMLREAGCDQLQGFHLARPVPAAEIARFWLATQPPPTSFRHSAPPPAAPATTRPPQSDYAG